MDPAAFQGSVPYIRCRVIHAPNTALRETSFAEIVPVKVCPFFQAVRLDPVAGNARPISLRTGSLGRGCEARTRDLRFWRPALYQLS